MLISRLKKFLRRAVSNRGRGNLIGKSMFLAYTLYNKLDNILYKQNIKPIARAYLRMKNIERQIRGKGTFITLEELVMWTNDWIKRFPESYDVIVGVPRGGLLIAGIIALKLGKPLSTPELFKDGKYWMSVHADKTDVMKEPYNVLLVDDNINHEETIEEPARLIRSSNTNMKLTRASLMVSEDAVKYVDMYYKVLRAYPPVGEWKLLHNKRGTLAVDMDGVICEDCPSDDVDMDEVLYNEWLRNARPYLIPAFGIDYIVSNRLEKYRAVTEEWLNRYGVRYNQLILWDITSKENRKGKFIKHKVDVLLKTKPTEYWESSYDQAVKIWEATKIPTICIDEMIAFGPLKK